jgi:hypothetical protein
MTIGPNDAGGLTVDEGGLSLACGGHVTPPVALGPRYHYHKSADCMQQLRHATYPTKNGGTPLTHGAKWGIALDGAGIYGYSDWNGMAPVVDECGGHFGMVPDSDVPQYHYHSKTYTPYTLV